MTESIRRCRACGRQLEPEARYCDGCGLRVRDEFSIAKAVLEEKALKLSEVLENDHNVSAEAKTLIEEIVVELLAAGQPSFGDGEDYVKVEVDHWLEPAKYAALCACTIDSQNHFNQEKRVNTFYVAKEKISEAERILGRKLALEVLETKSRS